MRKNEEVAVEGSCGEIRSKLNALPRLVLAGAVGVQERMNDIDRDAPTFCVDIDALPENLLKLKLIVAAQQLQQPQPQMEKLVKNRGFFSQTRHRHAAGIPRVQVKSLTFRTCTSTSYLVGSALPARYRRDRASHGASHGAYPVDQY